MYLTDEEERMASGRQGEAYKQAMDILVRMGEFAGAERMVPVSWADLTTFSGIGGGHGDSPDDDMYHFITDFEELCVREGAAFKTPTTLADVSTPERDRRMAALGAQLIAPAGASSPHDIFPLPLFGQYVTPGATNINTYCNGMLGARGNSEGPIGVRMAALTGRTPEYGYLLDENRHARTVVEVDAELRNYIDWSVLGYYVSDTLSAHYWDVPVLRGIDPLRVSSDDVIAMCATLNSPGSITHWLIEGLSPEARTLEQALGGSEPRETIRVGEREMQSVFDKYAPTGNPPEIVTLRFPLTVQRLYDVARMVEGKHVHDGVSFAVDLSLAAKRVGEKFGLVKTLERAGVFVADRQGQVLWRGRQIDPWVDCKRLGIRTMATDSLKDCNAIGNQEVDMVLLPTLEKVVNVALSGRLEA